MILGQHKCRGVSFQIRFLTLFIFRLGCNYEPLLKKPKCVGMNRRSSIRVDAITHRFEMATLFLVRVRRDSARTWDYAITNASVGVEKRVYLQKVAARSGSFPLRRSFLGPTASHFGAEGPRHRERNPAAFGQTFPARWHFLQPC